MARNNLGRNFTGQTPRSRGSFLIRDNDGKFTAQKWPKPRGKAKTPYDYYRQQEFKLAGRMASNAISEDIFTAWEMTKGTQQVPRDFITMCIFGSAYELVEEDGFIWPTFRSMAPNPQYMLDLLGNEIGSIIFRADIGWVLLPPGNSGDVLIMRDGFPAWEPEPNIDPDFKVIRTTLFRTTNQATTTNTEFTASFETALLDENEVWNPATPTRLYIPTDAQKIRLSFQASFTQQTQNAINTFRTLDSAGANFNGRATFQIAQTNVHSVFPSASAIGPWIPKPVTPYVELRLTRSISATGNFLANTSLTLEATY